MATNHCCCCCSPVGVGASVEFVASSVRVNEGSGGFNPRAIFDNPLGFGVTPLLPSAELLTFKTQQNMLPGDVKCRKVVQRSGFHSLGEFTTFPQTPWLVGRSQLPPQDPHPAVGPFRPQSSALPASDDQTLLTPLLFFANSDAGSECVHSLSCRSSVC